MAISISPTQSSAGKKEQCTSDDFPGRERTLRVRIEDSQGGWPESLTDVCEIGIDRIVDPPG